MKTIYYASCLPPNLYYKDYLLYQEPDSLYKDLLKDKDKSNDYNNYLDCPAFLKFIQNSFIVRSPYTCDLDIDYNSGSFLRNGSADEITEHFTPRPSCRENHMMFNLYHNFIFYSEDSIEMSTTPAFMHHSELQSKCTYIPGTYDVSKWFRMVDGAFEMNMSFNQLLLQRGDPIYYVKFNTTDTVKLVRFDLTQELWNLTQGCIQYKKYQPQKPLNYLYKLFAHTGMNKLILKKIKENLI